jgi:protein-S-isoprenylcysteine O-methyltransferase Ste14
MKRTGILFHGLANYLFGVAALGYLVAFLFNLVATKTIDSGAARNDLAAALVYLSLIALFGLQHSIMARRGFKAWLARLVPHAAERSTYMLATALVTFALCLFWQPMPAVVWQADNPLLRQVLLGVGLAGWGLVLLSSFLTNHFDLFGLRQVWLQFVDREYTQLTFKAVGLYRYIRHPILTGVLLGIWVAPTMTAGHLLFALGMTAYILIGVYHEEKDLIREFGEKYHQYIRATGRFLPAWGTSTSRTDARVPGNSPNMKSRTRVNPEVSTSRSKLSGIQAARLQNERNPTR